jgi:hypothetical protein
VVPLNRRLSLPQLLLLDLCLYAKVRVLVSQSLGLYPELFSLVLANLDLLVQHDRALNRNVVFRLEIL